MLLQIVASSLCNNNTVQNPTTNTSLNNKESDNSRTSPNPTTAVYSTSVYPTSNIEDKTHQKEKKSSPPPLSRLTLDTTSRDAQVIQFNKFVLLDIKQHGGFSLCTKYPYKTKYFNDLAPRLLKGMLCQRCN